MYYLIANNDLSVSLTTQLSLSFTGCALQLIIYHFTELILTHPEEPYGHLSASHPVRSSRVSLTISERLYTSQVC